jgi:hypothetical protein
MLVGVGSCAASNAVPASDALIGASLFPAMTEKAEVSGCVSALSREMGFDAEELTLVFEESFIAGGSVETTETGADSGVDTVSVLVGSVGGAATTFPEDALLVPTVTVPGEPEALVPAGVPGEPEVLPPAGAPGDEEDEGGGLVGGGVVVVEGSVAPGEELVKAGLSSVPPSSDVLAEL